MLADLKTQCKNKLKAKEDFDKVMNNLFKSLVSMEKVEKLDIQNLASASNEEKNLKALKPNDKKQ